MKIAQTCLRCYQPFWTETKYLKRGHGQYCSRSCASKRSYPTLQNRVTHICATCGKQCVKTPSSDRNAKHGFRFCSRKCKDEGQRIGGVEAIQPPHYGGGVHNYRERAFRDGIPVCIGCGYKTYADVLVVHHRDQNRANGARQNLAIVCPTCHAEVHAGHRVLPEDGGDCGDRTHHDDFARVISALAESP